MKKLTKVKEIVSYVYLFLLFIYFTLYTRQGFVNLADGKVLFYLYFSAAFLVLSLILLIITIIVRKGVGKDFVRFSLPDYAVLAYGLFNILAFVFSPFKIGSLFGYSGWGMGLITQCFMVCGYFLVRMWYNGGNTGWIFASIGLALESLLIIINRLGGDPLHFYDGMGWFDWTRRNLLGTLGNINWVCGYLVCMVPVIVVLFCKSRKVATRIIGGAGVFLSVTAILVQGSRSGYIALMVMLLILPLFCSENLNELAGYAEVLFFTCLFPTLLIVFKIGFIEPDNRSIYQFLSSRFWPVAAGVFLIASVVLQILAIRKKEAKVLRPVQLIIRLTVAVIFALGIAVIVISNLSDTVWMKLGSPSVLRFSDTWGSGRGEIWRKSISTFAGSDAGRFFIGFGPDAYGYWYAQNGIELTETVDYIWGTIYANAHNEWITSLINTGLFGFLSYLCIFVFSLVSYIRKGRKEIAGIIGVLVISGYFVNQFFSFQQICVTPLFFVLLGVCENCINSPKNDRKTR